MLSTSLIKRGKWNFPLPIVPKFNCHRRLSPPHPPALPQILPYAVIPSDAGGELMTNITIT